MKKISPVALSFVMDSPVGPLELVGTAQGLQSITFVKSKPGNTPPKVLASVVKQLTAYFSGTSKGFSLTLDPVIGTDLQVKIWQALCKVPFGEVTSYSALAKAAGVPKASRAVGSAMAKNPIPIIVPCHRVLPSSSLGKRSKPGNYSGGIQKKQWLLAHEQQ